MNHTLNQKANALVMALLLLVAVLPSVSAYHYACLTRGESVPTGYTCRHDCCILCVNDDNYPTAWYRCAGAQGCSCTGDEGLGDLEPPQLTLTSPDEDYSYSSRSVPFEISLSKRVAFLGYQEQGRERYGWTRLCPSKCSGYRGRRSFSDGKHNLTIKAVDSGGREDTLQVSFYVDSKPPRIIQTTPAANKYGNNMFTVKYSEANVMNITLYYGDKQMSRVDCPSGNYQVCSFAVGEPLPQGRLTYRFAITDRAQTVYSREVTINIDTVPPVLDVASPAAGIFSTRRIWFTVSATEPSSIYYKDATDRNPRWKRLCSNCLRYNRTVSLREGVHNITFMAEDKAGNNDTLERGFYVDSKPPRILLTKPKNGKFGNGTFTVVYNEDNIKEVCLYYTQSTQYTKSCTSCPSGNKQECQFQVGGLSQGWLKYYFAVTDVTDASAESKPAEVFIDTKAPELHVVEPRSTVYKTKKVNFDLSSNEPTTFEYRDGSRWKRLCSNCMKYQKQQFFRDGEHNISVRAIDKAGNQNTTQMTFMVDSRSPRILNTEPRARGYGNGTFTVVYYEDNPVEVVVHYSTDGGSSYQELTETNCPGGRRARCELRVTGLDGRVYYYFTITDISGNEGRQRRPNRITVDTTAPELEVVSPVSGVYHGQRIPFDINVSEKSRIEYINHLSNYPVWKTLCYNCLGYHRTRYFSYNDYQLTIRATDFAGNYDEQDVAFSVVS